MTTTPRKIRVPSLFRRAPRRTMAAILVAALGLTGANVLFSPGAYAADGDVTGQTPSGTTVHFEMRDKVQPLMYFDVPGMGLRTANGTSFTVPGYNTPFTVSGSMRTSAMGFCIEQGNSGDGSAYDLLYPSEYIAGAKTSNKYQMGPQFEANVGKITWIAQNAFPARSSWDFADWAGVGNGTYPAPLYYAAQAAIWHFTSGINLTSGPGDTKQVYDWLLSNAQNVAPAQPQLKVAPPSRSAALTATGARIGPITITAYHTVTGLQMAPTTQLPPGVTLTNAQGAPLPPSIPSGTDVYATVAPGTPAGSVNITFTGQGVKTVNGMIAADGPSQSQIISGRPDSATVSTTATLSWTAAPAPTTTTPAPTTTTTPPTENNPTLGTTAVDATDQDKTISAGGGIVNDTVTYSGLIPNQRYQMRGELMDATTMTSIGSSNSVMFTASATGAGSVLVPLTVDANQAGKKLVAFETVQRVNADGAVEKTIIASHQDYNSAPQTVNVAPKPVVPPRITTTAFDQADSDKSVAPSGTVVDEVAYENLIVGQQYILQGVLMDKATNKQVGGIVNRTFTPAAANGTINVNLPVPAGSEGATLVAYEKLFTTNGTVVAVHEDLNSASQTVVVPKIGTTASAAGGGNTLPPTGGVITDAIAYQNLKGGATYTVSGTLMDKATGSSTGITATGTFTADASGAGTWNLPFPSVPGTWAGRALVAFEVVKDAGQVVVAKHENLMDAAQTVTLGTPVAPPATVKTSATDAADGDKSVPVTGRIRDTVTMTGLTAGTQYTITGIVMNKDGSATSSTASVTFTAAGGTETQQLVFPVPTSAAGTDVVVFERVYKTNTGEVVATHTDINDAAQTVSVPVIGTTATLKGSAAKSIPATGGVITDTVTYTGLIPGKTYTLSAELMRVADGASTGLTNTATFTPTQASGTTTIDITVPQGYAGQRLVAFETLTDAGNTVVAVHKNLASEAQTVTVGTIAAPVAKISTTATDNADGDKSVGSTGDIKDTVAYTGLTPNTTYMLTGEVMNKATGKSVNSTAYKTFTADATGAGTTDLILKVPGGQEGQALVVFERLVRVSDGAPIAEHLDINDANQTVYVPDLATTATAADGSKQVPAGGGIVRDLVQLTNLVPGEQYTVTGDLVSKTTRASIGATSTPVTFTAGAATQNITITFTVPPGFDGQALVAFEKLFETNTVNGVNTTATTPAAVHENIADAAQTVNVGVPVALAATIATTATDAADGNKTVSPVGQINDHIRYSGLTLGTEYTVIGQLMDKGSGKAVGAPQTAKFVADATGVTQVVFPVPSGSEGKTLVVFETVYGPGGKQVAEHSNLNDTSQTVYVPAIGTRLSVAGASDSQILSSKGGEVTDRVSYANLVPGQTYMLRGELMDKSDPTGKTGTGLTAQTSFTPTTPSGTQDLIFKVPAAFAGKQLVAFESLYETTKVNGVDTPGPVPAAAHRNLADTAQMVSVEVPPAAKVTISTFAKDATDTTTTMTNTANADKSVAPGGNVVDMVAMTGLVPGAKYTLRGQLMDKNTGLQVGSSVMLAFTADKSDLVKELVLAVPPRSEGLSLVAFEYLYDATGTLVTSHADRDSASQTVWVPQVKTTASFTVDGKETKFIPPSGGDLNDLVEYSGVVVGGRYQIDGVVWNAGANASTGITKSSEVFTATATTGKMTLSFKIPDNLTTTTLVVFEKLYEITDKGRTLVAAHENLGDAAQTVNPNVEALTRLATVTTTATDKADGDKSVPTGGIVQDVVKYEGLIAGKEYTVFGRLMNKEDSNPIGAFATKKFTATSSKGEVILDIEVPAGERGKSLVVFETLYDAQGSVVGQHADINSADQTVIVPGIGTTATGANGTDKTVLYPVQGGPAVVLDKVVYYNLVQGQEYTVEGVLMDKGTGQSTNVRASGKFTAGPKGAGETVMKFLVPPTWAGRSLVAYEIVRRKVDGKDVVIASHADINDAGQTVTMGRAVPPPKAQMPGQPPVGTGTGFEPPVGTGTGFEPPVGASTGWKPPIPMPSLPTLPMTGVGSATWYFAGAGLVLLILGGGALVLSRRRRQEP